MRALAKILFVTSTGMTAASLACTDFSIKAQDNSVMVTRTMEFTINLNSNLRSSNKGRHFNETTNQKPGLSWKANYGYVFLDGMNADFAVDGMNEAGLSFEALYLPGETQYETAQNGKENHALPYYRLGDWILSQYKTTDEVKNALGDITVISQAIPGIPNVVFPLHFAVYDASGKSIVIEFVKGQKHIYDNDVGVLTNSPTYDWQMTNLRNYINLSPVTPKPIKVGNLEFLATGQGSGMRGLPGDVSPPSRFVKTATYKAASYPIKTAEEALILSQHIINNVDIPAGVVRSDNGANATYETTEWTVFKDLTNKVLYYRTYGDTTLHSIMLTKLDFSETAPRLQMPIADKQYIVDATQSFQQTPLNSTAPSSSSGPQDNSTQPSPKGVM